MYPKIKSVKVKAEVLLDNEDVVFGEQTTLMAPVDPNYANIEKHLSMGLLLAAGQVIRSLESKANEWELQAKEKNKKTKK
jgi:hypothetical protein